MAELKFLQIHSLHGYSSVLLNRDDSGLAKRIRYGGKIRTRISSQCLKRHWRMADGVNSLEKIEGATAASRSRETVTRRVIEPLKADFPAELVESIETEFQRAVYGDKGGKTSGRQPLLLGEPEILFLKNEARRFAENDTGDLDATKSALKEWVINSRQNMKQMRESCRLPGGLVSALFGRMVTSDPEANIDAAIHVAHSFTIHGEESESDYFTVVDDLLRIDEDSGADHIGETELTSGIFYGYVVVDREMLLKNLGDDTVMAGEVVNRLVHLIATISPGAKLGSTAPYDYAGWMLIEASNRQPRSLAETFRNPCTPQMESAEKALNGYIQSLDETYGAEEVRRSMSLKKTPVHGSSLMNLNNLATWAGEVIESGTC